ncbi:MAG TPA: WD40 repeat domain-containing protein [Candidatus Eisenbacteria bacterium]
MTAAILAALFLAPKAAFAVDTSFWTMDDVDGFLQGEQITGVAVDSDGHLALGPGWDSIASKLDGVSYIWSLARDSKGRVIFGTGDDGGIYRWERGQGAKLLWKTGSAEITSLVVDGKDNVYAGSTPGGTVFRVAANGDTSRYFETGEESIWSLIAGKDGALYAGTGPNGKIFKVTAAGKGTVYAETKDVNVLAMAWASDGALLAGTASKGLLVRVESPGHLRVIYDSGGDELRAIAVLPGGSIAVGTGKAGSIPRPHAPKAASAGGGGGDPDSPYAIDVTPASSGGPGGVAGRCGVFLVEPDGSARLLYAPAAEFIYAMIPADDHTVWVATGNPGALFRVALDRKFALLGAPDEKQVLALLRSGSETYAATGNPAVLYALGSAPAKEGTYLSDAHDLRSVASWGRAVIQSRGGSVTWSSRSGLSETPDEGWSDWSPETPLQGSAAISSPAARFLQFRLRLKAGGSESPVVSSIEVSYRQRNLPPELGEVRIFGPDNPFFEGGPEYRPPQISQTFPNGLKVEYSYPRSGPRTVSDPSAAWARGVRTATWDALDPNGDDLRFDVYIKAEDESAWRPLAKERKEKVLSWDAESFANGAYRLKVVASDDASNPPDVALTTERVGPVFRIDNVPPSIEGIKFEGGAAKGSVTVSGVAADADTRISVIEYSVDGGDWTQVFPVDGLFDQPRESFRFEVKNLAGGEHAITVRASDQDRNVGIAKVIAVSR